MKNSEAVQAIVDGMTGKASRRASPIIFKKQSRIVEVYSRAPARTNRMAFSHHEGCAMRDHARAGISEAVVVIFVFLALALLAPAILCYNLIDAKRSVHADLVAKIEQEEEVVRPAVIQRLRDAVEYGATGFDPDSGNIDMKARTGAAAQAAEAFLKGGEGGDVWAGFVAEVKRAQPSWEEPTERPANLQQMAVSMIPFVNDMSLEERVRQTPELTAVKSAQTAETIGQKLPD